MTDGIDSYKGFELDWAVGTVLENAQGVGMHLFTTSEDMVAATYQFIQASFEEEGLKPPSTQELAKLVSQRINAENLSA